MPFVGRIVEYAGALNERTRDNFRTAGWLVCDGGVIFKREYSDLYTVIGDRYTRLGETIPPDKFQLPDMRGRVPMGAGEGGEQSDRRLAEKLGAEEHSLTVDQLAPHNHKSRYSSGAQAAAHQRYIPGHFGLKDQWTVTSETGEGAAHNNIQPSLVINFLIRYNGDVLAVDDHDDMDGAEAAAIVGPSAPEPAPRP